MKNFASMVSLEDERRIRSENSRRLPISSFLVCKNEETHIAACLDSLSFCDEIVVVDSFSTDKTLEICKNYNVRLLQREWPGYKLQKEFACSQTKHEWVLFMDADEVVSQELREEILSLVSDPNNEKIKQYSAFRVKRAMFFLGKWWRKGGWYPEHRIRFFRRDAVEWIGKDPHENVRVHGKIGDLSGEIFHFSYDDIPDQIKKLSSHAFVRAKSDFDSGKVVSFEKLFIRPLLRFLKFYFIKKGYREGMSGLIVAVFESFYTFMKYARLWELCRVKNSKERESLLYSSKSEDQHKKEKKINQ